jgi:hypothetical protein
MEEPDFERLELLRSQEATAASHFSAQVVAHLKGYKPEISRIYARLDSLGGADAALGERLGSVEVREYWGAPKAPTSGLPPLAQPNLHTNAQQSQEAWRLRK